MTATAQSSPPSPPTPGPVMRAALSYQRFADRLAEWTGFLARWMVVATIVVGLINTVLRYTGSLIGRSLTSNTWVEGQWYLYSLIFLLGFNYILKHGVNVRVDFWFVKQSPRRKAWIDLVGHTLSLIPFTIIGIWVSYDQVLFSWSITEQSPDAGGLPRYPIKTMILVAMVLLFIQTIAEIIKLIAFLRGYEEEIELHLGDEEIRVE